MAKRRVNRKVLLEQMFIEYLVDRAKHLNDQNFPVYSDLARRYVAENETRLLEGLVKDAEAMMAQEDEPFWQWVSPKVSGLSRHELPLYGASRGPQPGL